MIQGVLFDLFETLVTESSASIRRASSLAAELGLNEDAFRRHWRSKRVDIVLGRCSFRDALAQIVRTLAGTPDERLLEHLRSERVKQKAAVLRTIEPDLLAAIGALRARDVKLAVVTNCFAEDVAGWGTSPLRSLFDVTVFSYAAGLAKPDPEIYLLACQELDVPPGRALFIGDGGDDELRGAQTAGLRTYRALWFLSRWPHATVARDDPGLWHAADVVDAAIAARVRPPPNKRLKLAARVG
jgi:HAD superfamily hydrolase (TIGR01509 family)